LRTTLVLRSLYCQSRPQALKAQNEHDTAYAPFTIGSSAADRNRVVFDASDRGRDYLAR
jgi:hypothetical protein